jgi:hypothetical protein
MRAFFLCALVGSLIAPMSASAAGQPAPTSVCQVIRNAAKLTDKRLRVEGYVSDLGSHGFVLIGKRRDCREEGILVLRIGRVRSNEAWRKAFAGSAGLKRAILVGKVGWVPSQYFGGRNPALTVERVIYLSQQQADESDF